jgi:HNH endonuclease/AP2 domain
MREIPLTQGQVVIVDDDDYEFLMQWRWRACWDPDPKGFYANRTEMINGTKTTVHMHRVLMGLRKGDKRVVDHINHNGLDNRRSNLRICTRFQNMANLRKKVTNTSGHTGVVWDKDSRKWRAQIQAGNKNHHLGRFDTIEAAVAARKANETRFFGEFAYQESA